MSNVSTRLKRVIDRNNNNSRYAALTKEDIEQAMIDALNTALPRILGSDYQSFYAYYDENNNIKIQVTRLIAGISEDHRYYFFNLDLLGEYNIRRILEEFQQYLDYRENKILYDKLKSVKNGLIYGTVIRYINDTATVEIYTDDGISIHAFCHKRYLIENERDSSVLYRKDSMPFYVKNIRLDNNSRLEVELSSRSMKLPELILYKNLEDYGYDKSEYKIKCIYRIPGKFSKIVVLNKILDKEIIQAAREELNGEVLRIISITDLVELNKFKNKLSSYKELAKMYDVNKKVNPKKIFNHATTPVGINVSSGSVYSPIDSIINKFKGK